MATSTDLRAAIEEVQLALPGAQATGYDLEGLDQEAALEKLAARIGAMPWWVISTVVHSVIFLLCTLLVATTQDPATHVWIQSDMVKKTPEIFKPKEKTPDIFDRYIDIKSDETVVNPVPVKKPIDADVVPQSENNVDFASLKGRTDRISDIPLGGFGRIAIMGAGSGGLAGSFGYRTPGGREHAVGRFGGSRFTESSVEAALAWLARHQEPDGHWEAGKWEATYTGKRVNVSMTGFALLAFLGAGYTDRTPRYGDNVRRAQQWLIRQQKKGKFGRCMYTQGIATLALAEAYGMIDPPRRNERLRTAAQDAVNVVVAAQGPYEAWNYGAKSKAGRNDTSVTGWNLMALKSARTSGLKVDTLAFRGCMSWLDQATDPKTGRCAYAGTKNKVRRGGGSHAMWAAGLLMRQFMGMNRTAPILVAASDSIIKHPPVWEKGGEKKVNLYYWYYGTLGMFQQGGKYWPAWNKHMKKALLDNQRKGGPMDRTAKDVHGSWDPVGAGGIPRGGRVFSTALGALCLEVYYRYLPSQGGNR
jgi:hypothetical protein